MKTLATALAAVLTAAIAAVTSAHAAPSPRASQPDAFLCILPKTVSVGSHSVSTPTICIPAPKPGAGSSAQ